MGVNYAEVIMKSYMKKKAALCSALGKKKDDECSQIL